MNVTNNALSIAQSHPVSAAAVLTTMGTAFVDFLKLIPNDIVKLAAVASMGLTFVLIYYHILMARKVSKEIQLLEQQIKNNENKTTPNC